MNPNIVHVINLRHRTDRLESFKQQANEQGFEYKVWGGIVDKLPFAGIAKAYKRVIQYAKDNNLEYIIVAEDDIKFTDKGAWNYFVKCIPLEFDIFLGSVYWSLEDISNTNIVTEFSGFTLTVFHSRFYDQFLSTPEINNIDRQMKIHKGLYKVCLPFVAYQEDGFSDHVGRVTNYNETYLKGKPLFMIQAPIVQPS